MADALALATKAELEEIDRRQGFSSYVLLNREDILREIREEATAKSLAETKDPAGREPKAFFETFFSHSLDLGDSKEERWQSWRWAMMDAGDLVDMCYFGRMPDEAVDERVDLGELALGKATFGCGIDDLISKIENSRVSSVICGKRWLLKIIRTVAQKELRYFDNIVVKLSDHKSLGGYSVGDRLLFRPEHYDQLRSELQSLRSIIIFVIGFCDEGHIIKQWGIDGPCVRESIQNTNHFYKKA